MEKDDQKKKSLTSVVHYKTKFDGNFVRSSCFRCLQYKHPVCKDTGEDIPNPVTGPVGDRCPFPDYQGRCE
jgi:hypothetical protein